MQDKKMKPGLVARALDRRRFGMLSGLLLLAGCTSTPEGDYDSSGVCNAPEVEVVDDFSIACQDDVWCPDRDGDGHGSSTRCLTGCGMPERGYVPSSDDCDDRFAAIHPQAAEVCNGLDDDCDGQIDEPCG